VIKALATTGDGTKLIVLGLSRENTEKLLTDKPILVSLDQFGVPGVKVVLIGGETEYAMVDAFMDMGITLRADMPEPDVG
jgi:hypothetical protein